MNATERRAEMLRVLKQSEKPITGAMLAEQFDISRQVVVQDIALLRASGRTILATPDGYMVPQLPLLRAARRSFTVRHVPAASARELSIMVSGGGVVLDVSCAHDVYGDFRVVLMLDSQQAVEEYIARMNRKASLPLEALTGGIHQHTVEADSVETLDAIETQLRKEGFLVEPVLV